MKKLQFIECKSQKIILRDNEDRTIKTVLMVAKLSRNVAVINKFQMLTIFAAILCG